MELLIGRQPIFSCGMKLVGYELLYRSCSGENSAQFTNGDLATADVILNSYSELGLDQLIGNVVAYINVTRNFLIGKYPIPLPPERVILEVLENTNIDDQLVDAVKRLSQKGYKIALDDVVSLEHIAPLLDIADVIKVDLLQLSKERLNTLVFMLRKHKSKLLAEKVETPQDYEYAKLLGFDFYQGYFFAKPNIVKGRRLDASRLVILRSLAKLQDPRADFHKMENIIAQDVSLGYKLIRLVNSAYYSTPMPVKSIGQAISMIGMNQLRGWLALLLMASIENKPSELTTLAISRAKLAEQISQAMGFKDSESFFLTGLFSVLDALMDMPMKDVLSNLPVSDEIVDALLYREGNMGAALNIITAYEEGNWNDVMRMMSNVRPQTMQNTFLKSLHWANHLTKTLEVHQSGVA